jgi:hypothetical protein
MVANDDTPRDEDRASTSTVPSAWDCLCQWVKAQPRLSDRDLQQLKPFFAWIPIETIKKTLENTTQYAKAVSNYPMVKHMVARFKMLNRYRLDEVVLNTTIPSSQLKKKQLACAYHRVREMIACRATRFIHIPSNLNCSDINTKPLVGTLHHRLVQSIFTGNGTPSIFNVGSG